MALVKKIAANVTRQLRKRGLLSDLDEDADEDAQQLLQMASVQGLVAMGKGAGSRVARGKEAPETEFVKGKLCASYDWYNLHAATRTGPHQRDRLERLIRYVARPPLSRERLSVDKSGWVTWRLRRAFSDGTTHFYFRPKEFIEKLVALIPRARSNLVIYHGILAPNANDRAAVVPGSASTARKRKKKRNGRPQLCKWIPWSDLMMRVFGIDVLFCACGGRLAVVRVVTAPTPADLAAIGVAPAARPPRPGRPGLRFS